MKTVATAQRRPAASEPSKGGAKRNPFFSAPVQARRDEEVQARLRMGRPGDRYEVEADRVADRVVDGRPAHLPGRGLAAGVTPVAQRLEMAHGKALDEEETQARAEEEETQAKKEEEETQAKPEEEETQAKTEEEETQAKEEEEKTQAKGEEEEAQAKEEEETQAKGEEEEAQAKEEDEEAQAKAAEEEEELQSRPMKGAGLSVSDEVSRQVRAARGRGNPLPGPVRDKMEAQFGADLSGVRIHTDAPAVLLASALKAQAFTRGNDIFFNEGKFAPGSRSGEHLLAHELTHTVQQGAVVPDQASEDATIVRLAADNDADSYDVRPEIVEAIRLARGEIGKVNAKKSGGDGKRVGWERLREYFQTAFGGPVVSEQVIDKITKLEKTNADGTKTMMDALPSWCGIFTWWAMKKAGIPIPDWKLGNPMLEALKPRAAGELPRKGDIAIDVLPNNHFAMVTGLESAKDAAGKPAKLLRVATINGNTAGEDNLGGQVQEKWDALSRWDHFLDPVGKMNLPEVPLVTVGRTPTEPEAAPPAAGPGPGAKLAPEVEGAAEAEAGAEGPEAADLETPVEAAAPVEFGEPLPEPDLTLPPRADAGPAEQVAVVEKADLSGSSDQATTTFIDSSPSVMAATQPDLAPAVSGKMGEEQKDLAENPPVLEAKTSGMVDAPITGPDEIPIPDTQLGDGVTGPDPGAIAPAAGAAPEPFRGNATREEELEKEQSGSFWDAFKNFLRGFVTGIRTRDDGIDTSAGARPGVALEGEAGPERMDRQREEGTTALQAQRDAQTDAFRNHPGQSNIQPRKLDEQHPATVSEEPPAPIEAEADPAVADYAAAPLPEDVRSAADAKVAAKLTPNLAEARGQATEAATTRDSEKQREIDTAQAAAARINAETDTAQRKMVVDNRGKVAKLQGEGIGEAYDNVNAFTKDAAKEQTTQRKEIGEHVKAEEGKATDTLDKAEDDAEKKKEEGEKEAAEKKKKLEEEQEEESWWDRVKSAIKKAVKVITEAIDKVFTAVRSAIKTLIDKAKNIAIGLINAARDWVVDKLNKFRDWAKEQVDKYLKDTFPGLAKRINDGIDAVTDAAIEGVNTVADAAIEGITKLADSLAAALDSILAKFQVALKTAVRVVGAVMQGDFAEALRSAIEGACEIAGVDPKPVFEFLDRAGKAITAILKDPVTFIKNLFGAVGSGIANFFKNIKTHLIQGVIGWLTGALSEVNLTGPFEFTPKGILRIVLEILGLTYANIKARVIKKVPAAEKVFDVVEGGFVLLQKLLHEGPGALWDEIKSQLSNLKETVMGAIRNWLITTVIKEGIIWLLSLTNPASAIVKAIKLLFDLVKFLIERYQQIKDFILSVYEAVAAMAAGNFTVVVKAVEDALVRVLPVLISLLASLAGLGGIAKQVKQVIETITKPINKAIDFVIDKIVAFAKKVLGKIKSGAKKVKEKAKAAVQKLLNWWKTKSGFNDTSGESHTLSYQGQKGSAKLYVASSNALQISAFLDDRMKKAGSGGHKYTVADVKAAQAYYKNNVEPAEKKLKAADTGGSAEKKKKDENANQALLADLQKHLDHLGKTWLSKFFDRGDEKDFPPPKLPVMADNVKARSFDADYLVNGTDSNGYKYKVKKGTESGHHVGNLLGWPELQGAKLTSGSAKYVRMHLLPHKLGGDAVDSNLTPARGDLFNTPFSAAVEQPAIQASTEGTPKNRKPIWYKFKIDYYPASTPPPAAWTQGVPYPAHAFPSVIHAEWGFYKTPGGGSTAIERDAAQPGKTDHPPLPDLAVTPPAINRDGPTALFNAINKPPGAVTEYFVAEILIGARKEKKYSSALDMKTRLLPKVDGSRGEVRREYVEATYNAVGTRVTMD
ncbi:MAG TPA: DUF4157 domain-containing protein [Dongiaceae bacterium]|jgi:hypothetical protein|nr:DUF4157 domain-containing protein [Dongiaceae bacterium]